MLRKSLNVVESQYQPSDKTSLWLKKENGKASLYYNDGIDWKSLQSENGGDVDFSDYYTKEETDIKLLAYDIKDRAYIANQNMGYKVLDKDKSIISQMTEANTIYEIRYDFDLGGETLTVPENCTLKFEGGSLNNGAVIGNNTTLIGECKTFLFLTGSFTNTYSELTWFGGSTKPGADNTNALKFAFNSSLPRLKVIGKYGISHPVQIAKWPPFTVEGSSVETSGFYANEDFESDEVIIDTKSYNATGLFYHYNDQEITFKNLILNSAFKAEFAIEHLTGYSNIYLENVKITNAKIAGLLQYGSEHLILSRVTITKCPIGLCVRSSRLNKSDFFDFTTDHVGNPNMVYLDHVRVMDSNYGFILANSSDVHLQNCQTSYTNIFGIYIFNSTCYISDFYSEHDATGYQYINSDGSITTSEFPNITIPESLINSGIDGYPIKNNFLSKDMIYVRGIIVSDESNLKLENSYISMIHRSTVANPSQDTQVVTPDNRKYSGADVVVLSITRSQRLIEISGLTYYNHDYPGFIFSNTTLVGLATKEVYQEYASVSLSSVSIPYDKYYGIYLYNGNKYPSYKTLGVWHNNSDLKKLSKPIIKSNTNSDPIDFHEGASLFRAASSILLEKSELESIFEGKVFARAAFILKVLRKTNLLIGFRVIFINGTQEIGTFVTYSSTDDFSTGTFIISKILPIYYYRDKLSEYTHISIEIYLNSLENALLSNLYLYNYLASEFNFKSYSTDLNEASDNILPNYVIHKALLAKSDKPTIEGLTDSQSINVTGESSKLYSGASLTSLTITAAKTDLSQNGAEEVFQFSTGASPAIDVIGVSWANSDVPTFEANKTYEIHIMYNATLDKFLATYATYE